MLYIIFLIIYFLLYYLIKIPQISDNIEISKNILIIINIILILSLFLIKFNILIHILIYPILIFCNLLYFNKYLLFISQSIITKYLFFGISIIFYIIYLVLFLYNIDNKFNIEFFIALEVLSLFLIEYIIITFINLNKIYYKLKNDDFSIMTINCFNNKLNNKQITHKYDDNYLKIIDTIPISFYNKNTKDYQDLVLSDFYYPGSYYSYLADSPLNGTPNLEALKIALTTFKTRIIHLDIFSDKNDQYDPKANPIIRCENMKDGANPLKLSDCLDVINKYAWKDTVSYPLFLYLKFNFNEDNENICIKIYEKLLKYFSKHLVDKKYSFSGRNNTFPISDAIIKDCLNKIIIVTNIYPTKTVLDELINCSTNNLNNTFNLNIYKESYITYDKQGLSQDNDKNIVLNNAKSTLNFYYTLPNASYKNTSQSKAGLYNPSFQDCAQYGIQGTLMYIFIPDDNLNKWNMFFKNKNNLNPVLKDESLRIVKNKTIEIKQQNPDLGLQKPKKYCLIPGLSTYKSNIPGDVSNQSSC